MKKKFFIKNLGLFLIPLLLPLLVFGIISIVLTQNNLKSDINSNNLSLLRQTKENVELVLNEIDQLSLVFDANPDIGFEMDTILQNDFSTYENNRVTRVLKGLINAYPNARPYIHSIYVYFDIAPDKFFSSTDGVANTKEALDNSWVESYNNGDPQTNIWTESREILSSPLLGEQHIEVISLFKRMYSRNGVIIMNILPGYMEKTLKGMTPMADQILLIINENNKVFFASSKLEDINNSTLSRIINEPFDFFTLSFGNRNYIVSKLQSERYAWKYVSIVPQTTLYKVPQKLGELTGLLLFSAFVLGLFLTLYITNRSYSRVSNIINILDSAVSGKPLPPLPDRIKDEYSYIINNILKTFIEQSYLKLALSEKKYKMKTMELTALQSQINPHFLFNTLKTIYWSSMSLSGGHNEVSDIVENLSDILNYSLGNPKTLVSLAEEVEAAKSYAAIQKSRYSNKFDIIWDIDEEVGDYPVIKLLMQPIIENSIYHGIKEKEGKSSIKVKAFVAGKLLKVSIIDTGIGIREETLRRIRGKLSEAADYSEHIGLYNTDKRLKLHYGEEYGLRIRSKPGRGTVVYMYIPRPTEQGSV